MALHELDEFLPGTLLGFVRDIPVPNEFIASRWLPNQNVNDLKFEYLKGVNKKTVMAHVMGFNSQAPIHGRPGLGERVSGELPPIKRKATIDEKEIIRFLQPRNGSTDVQDAIDSVYDLIGALVDAVQARLEWLRAQALSEDKIVYDEGGIIFSFDYGLNDLFQITLGTSTSVNGAGTDITSSVGVKLSDTTNADPIKFLSYLCDLVQTTTGARPATWVVSNVVTGYLLQNAKVRDLIRGPNAPTALLTLDELQALFRIYRLPVIQEYDVFVNKEEANGSYTEIRTMASNKSFFLPSGGTVGNTLLGPTAESRVLFGTPLASQAPGVFAKTYDTEEPPAEWVKAAAVGFPTMPDAHFLAQATLF